MLCTVHSTVAAGTLPRCLSQTAHWLATECRKAESPDLQCIIPLPGLPNWAWQQRTWVMAILNVTPDSFSDGGQVKGVHEAVGRACELAQVRPTAATVSTPSEKKEEKSLRCEACQPCRETD